MIMTAPERDMTKIPAFPTNKETKSDMIPGKIHIFLKFIREFNPFINHFLIIGAIAHFSSFVWPEGFILS